MALAIKTVTGISWTQHRLHQRFLPEKVGVTCDGEAKVREERKCLLADHLCSKVIQAKERDDKSANSVEGFSSAKAPLVYVKDLSKFLEDRLQKYENNNHLKWENDLPKDKIWLKIGGDHGGNSFKICLQILNVDNPNAKENTNVIACMQAKDNHENLRTITNIHKDQIECLSSQTWKNKRFRLFIFGDYAFLVWAVRGKRDLLLFMVPHSAKRATGSIESKRTVFKEKAEKHKKAS